MTSILLKIIGEMLQLKKEMQKWLFEDLNTFILEMEQMTFGYKREKQKIYMKDPETDELYYINWSQNNVYDTLTRPFQTVLRSIQEGVEDEEVLLKGFVQGIAEAAGQTASPFISESIYTETFFKLVPVSILFH
mgnify:CR=1 FL=1